VLHLNHGSFGAAPTAVLEAQTEWRRRIEANPMRFFTRDAPGLLDEARSAIAPFVGADADRMAFVPNASSAINAVLRSLDLEPGDEIVTTDLGYGGVQGTVRWLAARVGVELTVATIPLPITDPDDVVAVVTGAVGPRTRLVVVDHITSSTGIVMPVASIAAAMRSAGVPLLVDGAHAPGHVDLDVRAIDADYYTGNFHKWPCAPKGAAFLWVRAPDDRLVPTVVGWGRAQPPAGRSQFRADFDWVGTDDPSAYLCVPVAIETLGAVLPGGWPALRSRNRVLALAARTQLLGVVGARPPVPDSMVGSMAAIPLPPAPRPDDPLAPDRLQRDLVEESIEVAVTHGPGADDRWLRISAHAYNAYDDYTRLGDTLLRLGSR
jgi:isopenicillin-N epimerase